MGLHQERRHGSILQKTPELPKSLSSSKLVHKKSDKGNCFHPDFCSFSLKISLVLFTFVCFRTLLTTYHFLASTGFSQLMFLKLHFLFDPIITNNLPFPGINWFQEIEIKCMILNKVHVH